MKFFVTLVLLFAMVALTLASGSTSTTEYWYYDPSSTAAASYDTTSAPPCADPCGAKKLYFFY
ncbi:hypothetical protein KR009_009531 [Drosophila setifemur]|nr:hypothetical protein KR009_009531 [Drosophila setifemur]